jgi:hypothetical protein
MFSTHGSYELSDEGTRIIITASGPFNTEAAHAYNNDLMELYRKRGPGSYYHVIDLEQQPAFTPEALQIIREGIEKRQKFGLKAVAFVIRDAQYDSYFSFLSEKLFEGSAVQYDFFLDLNNARLWLDTLESMEKPG